MPVSETHLEPPKPRTVPAASVPASLRVSNHRRKNVPQSLDPTADARSEKRARQATTVDMSIPWRLTAASTAASASFAPPILGASRTSWIVSGSRMRLARRRSRVIVSRAESSAPSTAPIDEERVKTVQASAVSVRWRFSSGAVSDVERFAGRCQDDLESSSASAMEARHRASASTSIATTVRFMAPSLRTFSPAGSCGAAAFRLVKDEDPKLLSIGESAC
jgi:hypothetical protein